MTGLLPFYFTDSIFSLSPSSQDWIITILTRLNFLSVFEKDSIGRASERHSTFYFVRSFTSLVPSSQLWVKTILMLNFHLICFLFGTQLRKLEFISIYIWFVSWISFYQQYNLDVEKALVTFALTKYWLVTRTVPFSILGTVSCVTNS